MPDDSFAKYLKKQRANSISNGVLQNLRKHGKHVLFTKDGGVTIESGLSDSEVSPNCSLSNSEEDEIEDEEQELEKKRDLAKKVRIVGAKPSSPEKPSLALKKFRSYPHSNTFMTQTLLLDAPYYSQQNSQLNLPEFNKRPLTDTPIVSSVASPETRDQSSDESDSLPELESPKPMGKMKNISHLSLADLNAVSAKVVSSQVRSDSVSPTNTNESVVEEKKPLAARKPLLSKARLFNDTRLLFSNKSHFTPLFSDTPEQDRIRSTSPDARILQQIKQDLLQNVPPELQQQFEKTPSFEKLKNMLLLKPFSKVQKAYTLNIPGQTSSKTSPDGHIASVDVGSKLVIVMVGLPARGKSYITNKLTRYLNWLQHDCRVFNVGNTRRMDKDNVLGPASWPLPDTNTPLPHTGRSPAAKALSPAVHSADFFNPENQTSTDLREKWAMDTLDNLLTWVLDGPGSVGILDATNSTKRRRIKVLKRIQERSKGELKVLFLESICSDPAILDKNIRLKLSGPDYKDMDPEVALRDFVGRLRNYEKAYETIDDTEEKIPGFQYVQMIDVGKKVVSYNVQGFLASQTIYFLLNFNLCERQIWLTRHGESVDNLSGRIGGDSPLTKRGHSFAKTLSRFLNYQRSEFRRNQLESFSSRLEVRYNELVGNRNGKSTLPEDTKLGQIPTEPSFCVWTSLLLRAVESGNYFNDLVYNVKAMRMLNELGGGKYDGMTYDEIRRKHPKEFESRIKNKLSYRYPGVGGESYLDVLVRLRPVINEIERTTDHLLIVSHRVVLRVLLAYFLNLGKSAIVELDVPLHTLYCLELKPYGTEYAMYEYDEKADWFKKVEPDHQKNVQEVGVNFRERKYSVIPTAPPSAKSDKRSKPQIDAVLQGNIKKLSNFSLRKSISLGEDQKEKPEARPEPKTFNSSSSRKLADLQKLRNPQPADH